MASKATSPATNGAGARKCQSWIESFVEHTSNLESAPIYRKWSAISIIAATLEQKVWVTTSSPLYPNLYIFLVGHAGIGKSRSIHAATGFYRELPEPHIAPTSVTMASLVDHLVEAKRTIINYPEPMVEYNSLLIVADELSAFMAEYKGNELIPGLTTFYDCGPYGQGRRVKDIRIQIRRPQINILTGTTPSNLLTFIPEYAWDQGFTSRIIMVYADHKPLINIWKTPSRAKPPDMVHDLKIINSLAGQFSWTEEWSTAMHNWKELGFDPVPDHPKLRWYCERREAHMIKLSMIASVDRGNDLELTKNDFNTAMGWLLEAEHYMKHVFDINVGVDSKAAEEVVHFVRLAGEKGISESKLNDFVFRRVPINSVKNMVNVLQESGYIKAVRLDPVTKTRIFIAP